MSESISFDDSGSSMDDELLFRSASGRATPQEQEMVARWLAASPDNEQRFDDVVDVLLLAADADDQLSFGPPPSMRDVLTRAAAANRPRRGHDWRTLLLAAAAVAALAVTLPYAQRLLSIGSSAPTVAVGSDEFVTGTEAATVGLRDGSVVRLAPETRLRVHARQDGREVSLAGRGFFAITADPTVPFTIHSDAGTITVLGTRFDLAVNGEDLRLIVLEGSVRLSVRGAQVVVDAGQLAQVLRGNLVPPIDVPDPASLIGWMGNFIAFQETPLLAVAREIEQRYGIRIELADADLADRTVTALFAGRTYTEIVEVICVVANLECTRTGDVLRMAPAR